MYNKQNQVPNAILLQNFEACGTVCRYCPETGQYEELPKDCKNDIEISGTYTKVQDTLVGLFASSDGPILFKNRERYLLKNGTYKFYFNYISDTKSLFGLVINGMDLLRLEYDKPKYRCSDIWASEVDIDFFQWLQKLNTQEDFEDIFTKVH